MTSRGNRHRSFVGGLVLLTISWLAPPGSLPCCQADSPVHYFAQHKFTIPYSLAEGRNFRQMHLHASTDRKNYTRVASTSQRTGDFEYTTRGDGWYYFVLQIEEKDGTLSPRNVELTQPGLRVCVDTQKPKATLRPVTSREGRVAVEWAVSDSNLNLQSLRLEYRPVGAPNWIGLKHLQLERAQFSWNPPGNGPFEVRLTVADLAKNTAEATTKAEPNPNATARAGTGTARAADDRKVVYMPKKTFKLTYKIEGAGPSNVKHVEVWWTRDTSQWQTYSSLAPKEGPFEVTMLQQGRFGFTLLPVSGVGRKLNPPHAGDLPQLWVEVDETPPVVQLHNVIVGEGADNGTLTVNWRASDKFLGDRPITLLYADPGMTEWKVLGDGPVENTGTHKFKTEGLPFEFRLRIEAVDRAGNKAHADSTETVKVDTSVPKIGSLEALPAGDTSNKPPR